MCLEPKKVLVGRTTDVDRVPLSDDTDMSQKGNEITTCKFNKRLKVITFITLLFVGEWTG